MAYDTAFLVIALYDSNKNSSVKRLTLMFAFF